MIKLKHSITVVLIVAICVLDTTLIQKPNGNPPNSYSTTTTLDTMDLTPVFMSKSADEGLIEALEYHNIHHPDIVYAQALLETGNFTSEGCLVHNNLFGLYNSRTKRHCRFNHWSESVIAYKEWIQRRYKPPEDYYKFLVRIRYASDPQYIQKLKQIISENNDKRRYAEGDTIPQRV